MKIKKGNIRSMVVVIACAALLFTGCGAGKVNPDIQLNSQEEQQLTELLGDLNQEAPDKVRNQIGELLHKASVLQQKREAEGSYEMPDSEVQLWEKITQKLDEETIRQFGKNDYEEEDPGNKDYGLQVMKNLKAVMSEKDWGKLNSLRKEYFEAMEKEDEDYDVDIEDEIKALVEPYKSLDAETVCLNVLDEKIQKNLGIFCIQPDLTVSYQDGSQNGLASLSLEKQKELEKNWQAVTDILPESLFKDFKYFKVATDGEWGTYAYVIRIDDSGQSWCMAIDPKDRKEDGLFPYSVVHEIAHYLTFNQNQVKYFGDEYEFYPADVYSDAECAGNEESYLQAYYSEFWKGITNDWATDSENIYFYYRHQSELITAYASTDCSEDFAECFAGYVLLKKADTPELKAKFDFFDRYPEFRELKQEILSNVKANHVKVNPEIEPEDEETFKDAA